MIRRTARASSISFAGVAVTLALCVLAGGATGCAAYRFGPAGLYPADIRTVYVPVVRNDTFRHDLGVRLTEALIHEIETRTPYKVTGDPNADSALVCRVVYEIKHVLTETESDDPRALDSVISVRASWVSRSGEPLMQNSLVPLSNAEVGFDEDTRFVPEAGQTVATATQRAIVDLAQRIVSQMETRW